MPAAPCSGSRGLSPPRHVLSHLSRAASRGRHPRRGLVTRGGGCAALGPACQALLSLVAWSASRGQGSVTGFPECARGRSVRLEEARFPRSFAPRNTGGTGWRKEPAPGMRKDPRAPTRCGRTSLVRGRDRPGAHRRTPRCCKGQSARTGSANAAARRAPTEASATARDPARQPKPLRTRLPEIGQGTWT